MKPDKRSDEDRFQDLYAHTRRDLLAFAMRRAPAPEDAADILAETYLIAWRELDAIPAGDRARLWLFGVARNLLLKAARQARVRGALSERLATELRTRAGDGSGAADDPRLSRVRAALSELSDQDREILMLTAWEQLSPREIAAVINTPANTVRVRLHRARGRLARQLDEDRPATNPMPPRHAASDP